MEVAIIATHSDDIKIYEDDLFVSGGVHEYDVVSMPKLCGTPEHVFLVKIVENEADVPASTRSRGSSLVREHADGCFRAMVSETTPKVCRRGREIVASDCQDMWRKIMLSNAALHDLLEARPFFESHELWTPEAGLNRNVGPPLSGTYALC